MRALQLKVRSSYSIPGIFNNPVSNIDIPAGRRQRQNANIFSYFPYLYDMLLPYRQRLAPISMLQPFERFKPAYISKLLETGKYWLVSQTYHRYADHSSAAPKESLLLTDYADENKARAHAKALHWDPYAAVLHLRHPPHKAKLVELSGEHSRFHLFWAVVKSHRELEEKINAVYKPNMKSFIDKNTNWRISRDTILRPSIELVFGELFVILKHGNHTIHVKFEDIETA